MAGEFRLSPSAQPARLEAMCKWAAGATSITTYEEEEAVLTSFLMLALADVCRVEAASTAKATPRPTPPPVYCLEPAATTSKRHFSTF